MKAAAPPLLLLLVAFASSRGAAAQHIFQMDGAIHHPAAAGPEDFGRGDMARPLMGDDSLLRIGGYDATAKLVAHDEGSAIIEAHRAAQLAREEQLRLEQEEIARLLASEAIRAREAAREGAQGARGAGGARETAGATLATCLWTLAGCVAVAACGVVPAFLLPENASAFLQTPEGKRKLNLMLSFAVGSLLGDVFLHLLPETWSSAGVDAGLVGLWTIAGLVMCFFVEKLCASTEDTQHQVCAVMNLVGNLVDNFTHGLAVGASFLVGVKFGLLTTFAILIHEIPHEVSDFAILLRADYDRAAAVKAQLMTASGGVVGAAVALWLQSTADSSADAGIGAGVAWMLPFTAGGFINIALAQILPELMQETDRRQNIYQLLLIVGGVVAMVCMNQLHLLL